MSLKDFADAQLVAAFDLVIQIEGAPVQQAPRVRPTVLLPAAMKPVRATSGGNDVRLAGLACAHIEVERATGDYEAGSGKFAVEWKRAARKILTSRRDRKTGSAGTIPGIHEPQSPYQPSTPDVVVTMRPPGDDRQAAID